jgi:F-type H+-transporting ATPase subunit alpha
VPVEDIRRFETEFLDYLRRDQPGILASIRETSDLSDDTATALKDAIDRFRRTFEVTGGQLLVSGEDSVVEPLGEGEAAQESVARYRATDDTADDSDTAGATAEGVGLSGDGADASNASNAEGGE